MTSLGESPRIAIIGAGKHATANLYPALALIGVRPDAVVTRSRATSQAAASIHGIANSYASIDEMLAAGPPDGAIISLPAASQAEPTLRLLEAGVHVFVEKPMGWTSEEAKLIADTAESVGRVAMAGFMKRYAPSYSQLKEFADSAGPASGIFGTFGVRSFSNDPEAFIKFAAIHYLDLLRFVGGEVSQLSGVAVQTPKGVHFSLSGVLAGSTGFTLNLIGLPSYGRHYEEISVVREQDYCRVENQRRVVTHVESDRPSSPPRWHVLDEVESVATSIDTSSSGGWQQLVLNGYVGELDAFVAAVRGDGLAFLAGAARDNVATMALCEQVLALPMLAGTAD